MCRGEFKGGEGKCSTSYDFNEWALGLPKVTKSTKACSMRALPDSALHVWLHEMVEWTEQRDAEFSQLACSNDTDTWGSKFYFSGIFKYQDHLHPNMLVPFYGTRNGHGVARMPIHPRDNRTQHGLREGHSQLLIPHNTFLEAMAAPISWVFISFRKTPHESAMPLPYERVYWETGWVYTAFTPPSYWQEARKTNSSTL